MTENEAKIQGILAAFQPADGIYKQQAVDEAIAHQEEITSHLISILEDTLARPEWYIEQGVMSHIYAFILLGYFKEARAHRLLVDLFSLPEALIDPLFGELITEDLPMMLFRTSQGQVEDIKRLILNKTAYEYCRSAAMTALTYAVIEEVVSREEALEFLGSLFTGTEADKPDSEFWTFVASAIYSLYPEELMPVIEQAFAKNMIDPYFIGPEEYAEALEEGKTRTLQNLQEDFQRRTPDDLHKYMSWWAMFNQEENTSSMRKPFSAFQPQPPPAQKAQSAQAKKKKKRKMAKASKKKNRRR
jgi:hypothetical protein